MCLGGDWYTVAVCGFRMMVVVVPTPLPSDDRSCRAGAEKWKV